MWSCESTSPHTPDTTSPHLWRERQGCETSGVDSHFVGGVGSARLSGEEEAPGTPGGEPASEQLRGGCRPWLGEQRLHPAADVPQLRRAASQQRQHGPHALRGAQEVRDGVHALGEDIRAHAWLIVEQRTLVGLRRRRIHARAEVDVHPLISMPPPRPPPRPPPPPPP